MTSRVALSYDDKKITGWTRPSNVRQEYDPASSQSSGYRFLHTSMLILSIPARDPHYLRASWESRPATEMNINAHVKQLMGLDDAALAAGEATPKPKDQLPADGEVGGMPLKIDLALVCPKFEKGMRLKEIDELGVQADILTKKSHLLNYFGPNPEASRTYFADEVAVMDMLHDKPHDNIVKCLGLVVKKGYIIGIVLERYPESLARRCADKTRPLDIDIGKCIKGIADALVHLHDQGYCHNDVKPDNIMLKADGTPVLIDFDSCLPISQVLGKGTTPGWRDDASKTSSVKNDWLGLALVEEHLRKACLASSPE